ncbi:transcription factor subunit Med10 of mediator complex-domain-containing protein [Radiomyces spectabilis]|uniref:transcription factor subunit Med10 of mediator complex-domain-containing protein n=1 Tax=Radiomyces spectabilis TaxID=64574 RepID=UPI00221FB80C|nr:transcription factor subunit Med10 of mediator complex-domain-containing protein [Radiomyces spectabilis]KAI8384900.1 transcription factor subunit Med10 of mediator complex-domain-containing protein [Radiomyces spectabilis]
MQQPESRSSSSTPSSASPTQFSQPSSELKPNAATTTNARQALGDQLNELLQVLFELSVIVYDFQPDGNKLVWNKVNTVIDHYKKIDELKNDIDAYIPEEVINYVETGRNPDIFTQAFVERAATENQFTNGKIQAISDFKSMLSTEFAKSFPDLYDNTDLFANTSSENSSS